MNYQIGYERLLHILQSSRELFTDDVKKNLGRRSHDKVREAFWESIDEEAKRFQKELADQDENERAVR